MMLSGLQIFANLSQDHLEKIEEITEEVFLSKGAQLFEPGNPSRGFYVVRDGTIRVYGMSPEGKEITQEIAGQNDAFAVASVFSDTYHCVAEALKDSHLYLIKKKEFLDLLHADPEFTIAWMRMLSLMVIGLRRRLVDLTLKSPKARIASYILLLSEMQNSRSITLPVSRKELSTLLGMTPETLYRATKELASEGLVRFTGHNVDILKPELLAGITD